MCIQSYSLNELADTNHSRTNELSSFSFVKGIQYKKRNKFLFSFLTKSKMSYSSKHGHVSNILFTKIKNGKPDLDSDCSVFCSCPAFKWWGTQYTSTILEYNYENPIDIAPNIRDPKNERLLCKHLVAIRQAIQYMKSSRKLSSTILGSVDYDSDEVTSALGVQFTSDYQFESAMLNSVLKGRLV